MYRWTGRPRALGCRKWPGWCSRAAPEGPWGVGAGVRRWEQGPGSVPSSLLWQGSGLDPHIAGSAPFSISRLRAGPSCLCCVRHHGGVSRKKPCPHPDPGGRVSPRGPWVEFRLSPRLRAVPLRRPCLLLQGASPRGTRTRPRAPYRTIVAEARPQRYPGGTSENSFPHTRMSGGKGLLLGRLPRTLAGRGSIGRLISTSLGDLRGFPTHGPCSCSKEPE